MSQIKVDHIGMAVPSIDEFLKNNDVLFLKGAIDFESDPRR